MDATALSIAARELRDYLAPKLALSVSQITIGHPSAAAREQEANSSSPFDMVNLFFYRVDRDAYPADGSVDDPFYVRAHCLVTAFTIHDTENGVSSGEKELRLISGVMQLLHMRPFVSVRDSGGNELAHLQVVQSTLSDDDINHIWSTQGELPYRLSVAYELALLPVPLATPKERGPRVGSLALQVGAIGAPEPSQRLDFRVPAARVTIEDPAWVPVIRLIDSNSQLHYAATFAVNGVPTKVQVVGAGVPGTRVDFVWERWDSTSGWQPLTPPAQTLDLVTNMLPADSAASVTPTDVAIPDSRQGQLQLFAQRVWEQLNGGRQILRSNPLLISIHQAPP